MKMMTVSISTTGISSRSSRPSVRLASLLRRRRAYLLTGWQSKTSWEVTPLRRRHRRHCHLTSMLHQWAAVPAATASSGTASRGRAASRQATTSAIGTGQQLMEVCVSGQEDVHWTSSTSVVQVISLTVTATLATTAVLYIHQQSSRVHYGTSIATHRSTLSSMLVPRPVSYAVDSVDDQNSKQSTGRQQFSVSDCRLVLANKLSCKIT